jgi:hypothetical protein
LNEAIVSSRRLLRNVPLSVWPTNEKRVSTARFLINSIPLAREEINLLRSLPPLMCWLPLRVRLLCSSRVVLFAAVSTVDQRSAMALRMLWSPAVVPTDSPLLCGSSSYTEENSPCTKQRAHVQTHIHFTTGFPPSARSLMAP